MRVTIARFCMIGTFVLFSTASVARAEVFQWVDASGDTHFVSNLDEVPDQYREAAIAASHQAQPGAVDIIPGADDLPPAAMAQPSRAETRTPAQAMEPMGQAPAPLGDEANPVVEEDGDYVGGYVGDDGYYGDGERGEEARARSHQRQLERDAKGTRQELEGAEQIRERPPEEMSREPMREAPRGRR